MDKQTTVSFEGPKQLLVIGNFTKTTHSPMIRHKENRLRTKRRKINIAQAIEITIS